MTHATPCVPALFITVREETPTTSWETDNTTVMGPRNGLGDEAGTCSPTSVFFSDTEGNCVNVLANVGGAFSALTSN